jgi:oligogalacturonide lyase
MGEFAMRLRHLTGILAATLLTTAAAAKPVKEWVDPPPDIASSESAPGAALRTSISRKAPLPPKATRWSSRPPTGSVLSRFPTGRSLLVPGPHLNLLFTGHITRNAYYATRARDDAGGPFQVWAVDVDTGKAQSGRRGGRINRVDQCR